MKKMKVSASQVALVFKNGDYKKVLTTGTYWFWRGEAVYLYELTRPFVAPIDLNILLANEVLSDLLYFVDVKDDEVVLQYENGLLQQVLTTGRYPYWKTLTRHEFIRMDVKMIEVEYLEKIGNKVRVMSGGNGTILEQGKQTVAPQQ